MFREIKYETKYLFEELSDFCKSPNEYRWGEVKYRFSKIVSEITYPWYCFKRGIKNLIKWFPTIWNDRDWDHYYIDQLLITKLKSMEKFFDSDKAMHLHHKRDAKRIRVIRQLIEKCNKGDFTENWDKFEEEYGSYKLTTKAHIFDNLGKPLSYNVEVEVPKSDLLTEDEYNKLIREAINKDQEKENKYNDAIWRLMSKYKRTFWD